MSMTEIENLTTGWSQQMNGRAFVWSHFQKLLLDYKYNFLESKEFQSTVKVEGFRDLASMEFISDESQCEMIIPLGEVLIYVTKYHTNVGTFIAAVSREDLAIGHEWIETNLPEAAAEKDNVVPITFWSQTAAGPNSTKRRIEVPEWDSISENYTKEVQEQLSDMMDNFVPSHGGQLVIWEGTPGTGKTYSLRALTNKWRSWANFHYIVDPETFFGDASYMIQVLLQDGDPYFYDEEEDKQVKWKVLILEDCGELLSADAKERTGQAVARLLNVVDGMIGQGLKVLVLVTTNEPVKKFHSAITRPGRCAMQIKYDSLSREESIKWLKSHGKTDGLEELKDTNSIATLFGMIEGFSEKKVSKESSGFGFGS